MEARDAQRLGDLARHPDHAAAMEHVPPSGPLWLFGVTCLAGGGALLALLDGRSGQLVSVAILVAGAILLGIAVFFGWTPLERVLAVVVEGSGRYVTLDRLDGIKREYRAKRRLAATLTPGETGVAYLKAGFLLDFRNLR